MPVCWPQSVFSGAQGTAKPLYCDASAALGLTQDRSASSDTLADRAYVLLPAALEYHGPVRVLPVIGVLLFLASSMSFFGWSLMHSSPDLSFTQKVASMSSAGGGRAQHLCCLPWE